MLIIESIDDDDEVLTALADELGQFVDYIGGPEYAHVLLSPLDTLAAVEEPVVRNKAVQSLNSICFILSPAQISTYFLPLVKRLSLTDWFTSRASAVALYAAPYDKMSPETQSDMRDAFKTLGKDDTPMVRRAAATSLPEFISHLSKDVLLAETIPLVVHLAGDDQDSVRLLTIVPMIAIAEKLDEVEIRDELLQPIRALVSDKSWRVRYMIADNFVRLANALGQTIVNEELVTAFVTLLKDTEAEVRTGITGQIPGFCQLLEPDVILSTVMPSIKELVTDSSQHVRSALGLQLSGLAPRLGKEATIEHLLPMFLTMLKDEFPDVRLNIISKLELVSEVIGIEFLSQSLLPAIVELANDKQWRVRLAIIQYIPLLSQNLGVQFFNEKLATLSMTWLGDTVFSIREAAVKNLRDLTELFGSEWAETALLPRVVEMASNENYLYRMTTIFAFSTLAPVVNTQCLANLILPTLQPLVSDPIPNIRFNVAKAYDVMIEVLKSTPEGRNVIEENIRPALSKLGDDDDVDVRYFAEQGSNRLATISA